MKMLCSEGKVIALANRNRRSARPAPQTAPRRPARRPKKKKRINWFRVTVITLAFALLVLVVLGAIRTLRSAVLDGDSALAQETESLPEFFSTVRPESIDLPEDGAVSEPVSPFDGALFVGDSLTAQLADYVEQGAGGGTELSSAVFLTADSYSWSAAAGEQSGGDGMLTLDNQTVTLYAAILRTGAKKLYIQLGKEDLINSDVNTVVSNAQSVLSSLSASYPSLEITVQSVTPMLQWIDYYGLSSDTIASYNAAMKSYCAAEGFGFADVAAFFTEGYLPAEYCADPGGLCIHLNDDGCALWTSYLLGETGPEPTPTPEPEGGTGDGTGETGDVNGDSGDTDA